MQCTRGNIESEAVAGGDGPIGGWLACNWHVAAGEIDVDTTPRAQVPRANPHRG
jgi:hypothetical protein